MSQTRCRLCLDVSEALIDIFEESWKSKDLQKKISNLFSFLIEQNDLLRFVCIQCKNCVIDFYNFCQKVKETQIYLSQNDPKNEIYQEKRKSGSHVNQDQVDQEHFIENTRLNKNEDIQLVKDEQELKTCDIKNPAQVNALPSVCALLGREYEAEFIDDKEYLKLKIENEDDELDSDNNLQAYKEFNENAGQQYYHSKMLKSKNKLSECKLSKKVKKQLNTSNESPFLFPAELIRDGKLIMKGASLDQLIYKFYNIQCDICENLPKFKRISKLMKHFSGFHDVPGYLTCCNTRLHNHRSIYMHMAKHLQPEAFECPICKKGVTRPHTLKLHMQTHLPEAEKLHKCDKCNQSFSYVGGLKSHKKSHHVPIEERKMFNCNTCGKGYTFRSTLTSHMKTHQSNSKFLCAECGRTLQSKSELRCHMLTHDQTGKNKVQCKHCGFICKNLLCLRLHEKRHTGIKFTCKECPYTTHRKQQLKEHTRIKHTDDKPFICVVCGKSFKLKSVLNNHMARHTGEAKYNCPFCSRTFASSSNCYSHRKRMHADEYKNELNKKLNERFKKVELLESDTKEEMEINNIHKLAREYLRKV